MSCEAEARKRVIYRVTFVGFVVNLVLTAMKFAAGIVGRSGAMVAAAPLTSGRSVAYQPVFQLRFPSLPSCSGSSSRLSRGSLYISTRAAISSSLWFIRA